MDFNEFHPNLKSTYEKSKEKIILLDLVIKLADGKIVNDLYCQPTVSHQHLYYDSSHVSRIQYGGIRTFLSSGVLLSLRVLGHFGLKIRQKNWQRFGTISIFMCQTALILPNIYYSQKELKHFEL